MDSEHNKNHTGSDMKNMKIVIVFLALMLVNSTAWSADIRVCQTEKSKYKYRLELAKLILNKTTTEFGPAQITRPSQKDPTQSRCIHLLENNSIDLVYLPATAERLSSMEVLKIDMHNGMLGYRVLLINRKDKDRFSKVKTIDDLRKFKGGFGKQWGDFKIFKLNDLPVVGATNTQVLLKMLNINRFEYFHRGLHEAWEEVGANQGEFPDIMVEETIALFYDFPVYFMFNKTNHNLKKRFETGFQLILKDGSYKELYLKNFGTYAQKANLKNRVLIPIEYPTPKGLPPVDTSLWLE